MNTRLNVSSSSLQILRLPEVCGITGLGRSMIYQLEADGSFPQRIKLTARTVGWLETEVRDWLTERIACSRSSCSRAAAGKPENHAQR
jgi:prophage regulatory protein